MLRTLWINLRVVWKDPMLRKFYILQEVVVLLGLFEYVGLPLCTFFIGRADYQISGAFGIATALSFYTSSKLGWYVQGLQIKIATRGSSFMPRQQARG